MISDTSRRGLEQLPVEIVHGPYFYQAFLYTQPWITENVLLRQIPTELLHDALAAEVSSHRDIWTREQAEGFLAKYLARDQQPFHGSLRWTLSQALSLARFYRLVEFFTASLVSSILAQRPSARPLSPPEKSRIDRNFYRFHIYCNVFRNKDNIPIRPSDAQRKVYFAHFAPWENEQLACIQDYLHGVMTPVFEEVAGNDPKWISFFAIMENGLDEGAFPHHLSFGLEHLRHFFASTTPESQRELLSSVEQDSNVTFLSAGRKEANYLGGEMLAEMDVEDQEDFIHVPLFHDSDSGPEDVWRWAHQSQCSEHFVYSPAQIPLRQWAYVLWDRARLDEWEVFEKPWEGIDVAGYERQEQSRRLQESGDMQIRAQNYMVRDGRHHGVILRK